jgi:hypothetical protein
MGVMQNENGRKITEPDQNEALPRHHATTFILVNIVQIILVLGTGMWLAYTWSWLSIVICVVLLLLVAFLLKVTGTYKYSDIGSGEVGNVSFPYRWRRVMILLSFLLVAYAAGRSGMPSGLSTTGTGLGWMSVISGILGAISNIPLIITAAKAK